MASTTRDLRRVAGTDQRRAALRQLYVERIAPTADPLVQQVRRHGRTLLRGLAGVALAVAVAGALLYSFDWPTFWWSDPAALVRVALAASIIGLGWLRFNRRGMPLATASTDVASRVQREVLPMALAALRPSATYAPEGTLDRGWIRRSALVDGVQDYASEHLVTWDTDRTRRQITQVEATRQWTDRDGDTSRHIVFRGIVAVAELPVSVPGHVRIWASDVPRPHEQPSPVSGLAPVPREALGAARAGLPSSSALDRAYEIGASSSDVAVATVSADVVDLLNRAHRGGHRVRVAIAHRELVVAFDRRRQWFRHLALEFGAERFVEMGETLDLVDALAAAITAAYAPAA